MSSGICGQRKSRSIHRHHHAEMCLLAYVESEGPDQYMGFTMQHRVFWHMWTAKVQINRWALLCSTVSSGICGQRRSRSIHGLYYAAPCLLAYVDSEVQINTQASPCSTVSSGICGQRRSRSIHGLHHAEMCLLAYVDSKGPDQYMGFTMQKCVFWHMWTANVQINTQASPCSTVSSGICGQRRSRSIHRHHHAEMCLLAYVDSKRPDQYTGITMQHRVFWNMWSAKVQINTQASPCRNVSSGICGQQTSRSIHRHHHAAPCLLEYVVSEGPDQYTGITMQKCVFWHIWTAKNPDRCIGFTMHTVSSGISGQRRSKSIYRHHHAEMCLLAYVDSECLDQYMGFTMHHRVFWHMWTAKA